MQEVREQDDTSAVDAYVLDHDEGLVFSPVVVPAELRDAVRRGWAEEVSPKWFRLTRIGKLRARILRDRMRAANDASDVHARGVR